MFDEYSDIGFEAKIHRVEDIEFAVVAERVYQYMIGKLKKKLAIREISLSNFYIHEEKMSY
jgi:hypothetical protein